MTFRILRHALKPKFRPPSNQSPSQSRSLRPGASNPLRVTYYIDNASPRPSPSPSPPTPTYPSRRSLSTTATLNANNTAAPKTTNADTDTDTNAPLPGTTPSHHLYVFLHTPTPPTTYPARLTTPLQRRLLMATRPCGGTVNFAWSPSASHASRSRSSQVQVQTQMGGGGSSGDPGAGEATGEDAGAEETYRLTAFSSTRGKLEIDNVSLANVDDVGRALRAHVEPPPPPPPPLAPIESDDSDVLARSTKNADVHLYVCTHAARDCRCGTTGSAVADAIRAELYKRQQADGSDPSTRIRLAEVAHVGGHRFAANMLVYPHGEWLGRVQPENVPEIIDAILERPIRPMHPEEMPICMSHWRGRMGLNKEEQIELFNQWAAESDDWLLFVDVLDGLRIISGATTEAIADAVNTVDIS